MVLQKNRGLGLEPFAIRTRLKVFQTVHSYEVMTGEEPFKVPHGWKYEEP